jgi:hypothetical protein
MSWAAALLQTKQSRHDDLREAAAASVDAVVPALAHLSVWNLMQAFALMHWLRSCWLAAVGLPPEDEAAGEGLAAEVDARRVRREELLRAAAR